MRRGSKASAPEQGIVTTPVFDAYWRFAAERQAILMRRLRGADDPWTDDPVLQEFKFTNAYRVADRVSQYLIQNVQYKGPQNSEDLVFRTILFKLFNRVDTWELLEEEFGEVSWQYSQLGAYAQVLDRALQQGKRIYSAAYIMPPPSFGGLRKHHNHLRLLDFMMQDGIVEKLVKAESLQEAYEILRSYPFVGPFLAYQLAIDLNYSRVLDFSEMDFVVAGPGAIDGIKKCFSNQGGLSNEGVIEWMCRRADEEFEARGLSFERLGGRPLQLVDCQNLFCEISKYARVTHPEHRGVTGRSRIKQRFQPRGKLPRLFLPPKWQLH